MIETNEQLFLRVVEAGSLKAAAEQVGTDPSSVSRKIAGLEARLGVKLLQRSTRRSEPTEAGFLYYEGMRKLLDEQAALEANVARETETPRGLLRVSAPNNVGEAHVAPVLTSMVTMYPDLKVELILMGEAPDLNEKGIDVSIRVGPLPDSTLICRKLAEVPMVLVASPGYLKGRPFPNEPRDLLDHDFLLFSRKLQAEPLAFIGPDGLQTVKVTGKFIINSVSILHRLTEEGLGISIGSRLVLRDRLDSGELVQLLPGYQMTPYPLYATYASTAFVPAKIRCFVDLMVRYSSGVFRD
ncbi:LysR family transcriptional regulator [Desulfoluna sp.]|uniref:LysR family transcriptional regulator n=1 Tax=Desulfoluna sp. TaxID=2045199 RepID=UPI00260AF445|nr:LysR family transcriptional regulator [Desulfoluna sp.]